MARLVLLAAGASRRLGRCKALVPLREEAPRTPLELLLGAGRALVPPTPLCVTGRHHAEIEAAGIADLELVRNRDWARGRTGSVLRAVERAPGEDLCLAPVDVPGVPEGVFTRIAAAWEEAGEPPRGWLAPRVGSGEGARHGHPVLVGRGLLALLAGFPPDRPLRSLRALARPLLAVEVDSDAVLEDLDEARDLERFRARFSAPEVR